MHITNSKPNESRDNRKQNSEHPQN